MAFRNLLDITLPTTVIVRAMYDEFQNSARYGANTETLPVNGQRNASVAPAASKLGFSGSYGLRRCGWDLQLRFPMSPLSPLPGGLMTPMFWCK